MAGIIYMPFVVSSKNFSFIRSTNLIFYRGKNTYVEVGG